MANKSLIDWTDSTWNYITGCNKISEGCANCYAERVATTRLRGRCGYPEDNPFKVTLHPDKLEQPLNWKRPRMIFVCSMSDLFNENVPDEEISKVFEIMRRADHHIFQVLTKRAERMQQFISNVITKEKMLSQFNHVWCGVSIENNKHKYRADFLRITHAVIKFISFEPLIGPVNEVDLSGINWVIVGGETGGNARQMQEHWVDDVFGRCHDYEGNLKVPFFFKQWGVHKPRNYNKLYRGEYHQHLPAFEPNPERETITKAVDEGCAKTLQML